MATHPRLAAVAVPLALTVACTTVRTPAGGDAILVVRAQAVSRTAGRRADQKAAVAGIAVGAVVVAAVIVIALASGKGHGGPPRGIGPGRRA
jgi:hypothetical protein